MQPIVKPPRSGSGIAFAVIVFLYQVMICLFYGFWFQYEQVVLTISSYDDGPLFLVATLTILAIIGILYSDLGFGLTNAYITNASFSGMGQTLLLFVLTLEHYFLIKAFWQKAGTNDPNNSKSFTTTQYSKKISFVNTAQDRNINNFSNSYYHDSQFYIAYSFVDAIACAIANIVAFSSVVGRIKFLEVFFLSLFGTFIYEINNQLFFRYYIFDTGYGMRIFIFGGIMGLISSCILGKKQLTLNHPKYMSIYSTRSFALIGLLVAFCTFPTLVAGSLYFTSVNNNYVLYPAVLRMYLALVAGVLGTFAASALTYRKIHIYDLVFGGLIGGIAYSSSSDLHPNPTVPLIVGFVFGLIANLRHSNFLRSINKNGVALSLSTPNRFLIPGVFSGIPSAILYAINQGSSMPYVQNIISQRNNIGQGGMQMADVGSSLAIGIVAGVLYKISSKSSAQDEFNDGELYRPDFPPSVHIVD